MTQPPGGLRPSRSASALRILIRIASEYELDRDGPVTGDEARDVPLGGGRFPDGEAVSLAALSCKSDSMSNSISVDIGNILLWLPNIHIYTE